MFDIDKFNVIQDDNNYYVFRSLEAGDISDMENGITDLMRTDRERYINTPKYSEDSTISLEEMFDHIKIHYRKDTNCISFTTNAGVAIMYGRDKETYKDGDFNNKYVMLKVPKNELGTTSHFAPDYMISEIEKVVDEYYEHLDELDKYQFDRISNCITQEQLDSITKSLEGEEIFEGGIEFGNTNSTSYTTLSSRQNLEKNKLIAKIDLIPYDIVPNVSNKFLIQTIGSAFASMEVTHYKSITKDFLIDCPNNIIDIFSILQQSNNPKVKEIEKILVEKLSNGELNNLEEFKYNDYELTESDLSIDNLYTISDNGKVDYDTMRNLYIKTFYLAKSKLRVQHSINLLKQVFGNEYNDVLEELFDNYGIEPEITNKQSKEKIVISDSLGLEYSTDIEKNLLILLTGEYAKQLDYLIDNKEDCVAIAMLDLLEEHKSTSKEDYYANAIIDTFDWKQFNITSIALRHRNNLVNKLKESSFMSVYDELKNEYSAKDVSRILLANIINDNNEIDKEATFTIEQLEDYLGYYKVKDKDIKLTRYQADAIRNMKKSYKYHRYTNVILPTGTGKSYVAITEMLEYLNTGKKVLYLAPDVEILNQIRFYLVSEVIGDSFNGDLAEIVKEKYPNLVLQTYTYLTTGTNSQDIINDKYDFIVTDELHRTGAPEWKSQIEALYNSQDEKCKMLGITATPTRDCDGVDMAEYWADFFGYTKEEIYANHHLAYNMDYNQAIALGYLANPRVINCEYEFLHDFEAQAQSITNEEEREKILTRLRKDLSKAKGVPEILRENVLPGDACLVFCPMMNVDEETGERITGEQVIEKYQRKLEKIYGKDTINCYSMLGTYGNKKNQQQLENFQNVQSDKINFMIVIGKMDEGKHGNYNKLIWFRSLGDNSYVLCSQQLGRISRLLKPGEQIREDKRPLAIDLPNNLLRIQGTKEIKKSVDSDDISKFRLVINWIKEYNKIPDINSKDYVESSMASALKIIIFKYHNKVKDIESINNYKKKIQTLEIKRLSEEIEINIWDLNLPKRNIETKKRRQVPYYLQANPLYRDYSNIMNDNIMNDLSVEDRINEIYAIYEKTGKMPNTICQELFSNGVKIGPWINRNQETIMKLAQEGNEHAKVIVEKLKLDIKKIKLSDEQRIEEIYAIYGKTGKMPNTICQELFSNGVKIGGWIDQKKNQETIMKLAQEGNEHAKVIVEKLKLDIIKIELSDEQRIEEIYAKYEKTGKMPNTKCQELFSNGVRIGPWMNQKKNQETIIKLAQEGNEHAKVIVEMLKLDIIKIELSDEQRIEEIYAIYEKTGKMPNTICQELFSNGVKIQNWIRVKKNQETMIKLAQEGNEHAKVIVEMLKLDIIKIELSDEQRIEEIYAIYEKTGKMPNTICQELFSNGVKIRGWINNKKHQETIIKFAQEGNEHAKVIAEMLKLDIIKIELSDEQRIEEIYAIYEKTGKMPNSLCQERFSNGVKIGSWITDKKHQETIIKLAQEENEHAKVIVKSLKLDIKKALTNEQRIEEIYAIYEKTGKMPNTICQDLFSNGVKIQNWIRVKNNQETMIKLAQEGNEHAKVIVEMLKLDIIKIEFTDEQKIEEIYAIYEKTGKMPNTQCQELFSNGAKISSWIGKKKHRETIIKLAQEGNEHAKVIVKLLKLEFTDEQRIEEIYAIYEKTGKMPNTICQELFSNGVKIRGWIQKKNNQETIIKLAQEGNEHAKVIVEMLKLDIIKIELSDEQRIEEIYAIYEKTRKMPNTQCQELFSNGVKIGSWINDKKHQETIIKLAQEGNEHAKVIVGELELDSRKVIMKMSDEQRIEEIYAIYEKKGKMPNTNCQELFSNGVKIGPWMNQKKNQETIIKLAQEGNEHAKVIVEMLKLDIIKIELSDEQRIEEIYAIYEKTGKMPNTKCQEVFSNGVNIGNWINDKKHQETIIKLAQEENEHAKVIVGELELDSRKVFMKMSDEQRIEEIYEIYETTGKMPNTNCQELFSNGANIGDWINKKRHQETIMKLAQEGNEKAQTIIKKLDMFKDSAKSIKIDNIDIQKIESTSLKVQEVPVEASIVKDDNVKKKK